ncbi:MAG: peptidoglycan-associated lipoprotein Pal [Betaproteobacteria bacterium]|jgi:peptidoglycan-associated lipoprotein|uniref:Peptidoglycan-associated lipoprotein n=1 Tax=Thiomonas delicata TaxID=364030 RepID=A0A238D4C2_THIDL|nr:MULTISPECIES: peptidoglycan-associated lipoprotein Pal [Thiomonas]MDE2131055.1 peptidoglycan-associated lipoprotein Pal [Betaproteobacteria bacterium]SBP88014.1 Peptidoglycan-associated lipoprotein (19 kDa surface antigen) (PPL) [Thiomonas delicata]
MNQRSALLLTALAAALTLGGCASGVKTNKAPVESQTAAPVTGNAGANAQGAGQSQVAAVQAPAENNAGPGPDVPKSVYFAFNSYVVESKYRPVLENNAQYLVSHPAAHVQLQGNTDARGSREYNLALGQKRADAVMKGMELLGVKPSQMEAISFGKEKPKALGTTEADYAENRRVDIVYQK